MGSIFTVGHGTRSLEELVDVLEGAGVNVLIDVRRFPGSRRNPHLARGVLQETLPQVGIDYEWWGETLGGRRKVSPSSPNTAWRNASFRAYADHMSSEGFRRALKELQARSSDRHQAVMCAETLWWRCHRRLIADALVADGYEVIHLGAGRNDHHTLNEAARVIEGGGLVYDRSRPG